MQIINKLSNRRFAGRVFSYFLVFSLLSLNVFSCAQEAVQKSLEADKIAFGKINRINVLCDQSVWDGPLGDSIRFYYSAAYPTSLWKIYGKILCGKNFGLTLLSVIYLIRGRKRPL
jgi:hypothetical protein